MNTNQSQKAEVAILISDKILQSEENCRDKEMLYVLIKGPDSQESNNLQMLHMANYSFKAHKAKTRRIQIRN